MYCRPVLEHFDGFPTEVSYGEEPFLCWRIRNETGLKIYQMDRIMAEHDLGFVGLRDYWKRSIRCGATYFEIARKCMRTRDKLWLRETLSNAGWAMLITGAFVFLIIGPSWIRVAITSVGTILIIRKFLQTRHRGYTLSVSLIYAVHTYFSKLGIAFGEASWLLHSIRRYLWGKRT